jgi:hypothetical protein
VPTCVLGQKSKINFPIRIILKDIRLAVASLRNMMRISWYYNTRYTAHVY